MTVALALVGLLTGAVGAVLWVRSEAGRRAELASRLSLTIADDDGAGGAIRRECLRMHCSRFELTNVRQVAPGGPVEEVYQVRLRRESSRSELPRDLEHVRGLSVVALLRDSPPEAPG
jgi:hypothetical protein